MKLHLVTAALLILATAAPAAAGRNNLRRRQLNNLAAFQEDVVDAHRRLHCQPGDEQDCVRDCRNENNCQSGSDSCTKSCRAKCCEGSSQGIDIPDRPEGQERMCDREDERACFSECKQGDGQYGKMYGKCKSDDLSSSEQDECVKHCRDNCCEWEQSVESKEDIEPTPSPTPGPTPDPTRDPTRDPTPGPTPDPTPGPTPGPTPLASEAKSAPAPICTTDMAAEITCTVMDKAGNFIADCNDDDLYSKTKSCEVQMKYCFGARHADEDNAAAAQCLFLEEAHANMNGNEMANFTATLCEDTKMREDGTYDCEICKNRSNPAHRCETMDVNICECVESKTTMDFVATQDGAECPAADDLLVDICGDCDIDIKINCMARSGPFSDTWIPGGCSSDNGFSIVGVDECMEDIKFCYEIHNTGDTCAYWNDLDMGASRTVTNGDLVQLIDITVDTANREDAMICPGDDPVVICEETHVRVDSCKCMTVIAEARAKNPRNGICSAQANYGFCKEEESRSEESADSQGPDPVPDPTPAPVPAPKPKPEPQPSPQSEPSIDEVLKEESVSEESKSRSKTTDAPHPSPTKKPTKKPTKPESVSEESVKSSRSHTTDAPHPSPTKAPYSKPSPSVSSESRSKTTPSPHTPPTEPSMKSESSASAPKPHPSESSVSESSVSESSVSESSRSSSETTPHSLPSSGSSKSEAHSGSKSSSSQSLPSGGSAQSQPTRSSSQSLPSGGSVKSPSTRSSSSQSLPSGGSASSSGTVPSSSGDSGSSGASGGSGKGKGKGGSSGIAPSSSGDTGSSGASGGSGKGKGGSSGKGKGGSSGSGKGSKSGKSSSSGTGSTSSKTSKSSKSGGSDPSGSASVTDSNSRYYPKSSKSSS